jgi:hypothetical protein
MIQERVIELFDDRADCPPYFGVVHYPFHAFVQFALAVNAHLVAMPVKVSALVACRHLRQLVRGLKTEVLPELECVIESVFSVHRSLGCLADS